MEYLFLQDGINEFVHVNEVKFAQIVSLLNVYCNRDVCCICKYIYIDLYIHEIYIYIYIYLSYHIGNESMVSYR